MAKSSWPLGFLALLVGASLLPAQEDGAAATPAPASEPEPAAPAPAPGTPVKSVLEAQVALHRRGFSCGSIDGVSGAQTGAALAAFQRSVGIRESGALDEPTRDKLRLISPALGEITLTASDIAGLRPVPTTWLEKSTLDSLGYATALEKIAERYHAHPKYIQQLNPKVDWNSLLLGARITVPLADQVTVTGTASQVVISLGAHQLEVLDDSSRVIAHFPVSIAKMAEKRPVGNLQVTVVITDPNYTFDPAVFPESAEAKTIDHRLTIPPGPNNPVGLVWIGLNLPGYGIHGTPDPEHVGRTESHGCFRLANWDALTLAGLMRVGMTVIVEP